MKYIKLMLLLEQVYIKNTPILLPFVPIYSVERHKWLQA